MLSGVRLLDPSVHGIFQARILQWVALPFSRDLPGQGLWSEPPRKLQESAFKVQTHSTSRQVCLLRCYMLSLSYSRKITQIFLLMPQVTLYFLESYIYVLVWKMYIKLQVILFLRKFNPYLWISRFWNDSLSIIQYYTSNLFAI